MSYSFNAPVIEINGVRLLRLPADTSRQLPSRGMVMVEGTLDGKPFQTPVEPDGKGGHWLRLTDDPVAQADAIRVTLQPCSAWPEPMIARDITAALENDVKAHELWQKITPMARWDWLRWINSTSNPATRAKRIEVACDKLSSGSRRPCCFNRSACTVPEVAKSGILQGVQ